MSIAEEPKRTSEQDAEVSCAGEGRTIEHTVKVVVKHFVPVLLVPIEEFH